MQYIGRLDKQKLGKYRNNVVTSDVIITEERIKHIKDRHPGDYEIYGKYIIEVIKNPSCILEDSKNKDTIIMLKKIPKEGKNIQIVIKLATSSDKRKNKNTILTFWKIRNSTYKQMVKNKKIIYKFE